MLNCYVAIFICLVEITSIAWINDLFEYEIRFLFSLLGLLIEYYNIGLMLCFYLKQKNSTNCNMDAVICKNKFTCREDNISSVKSRIDKE